MSAGDHLQPELFDPGPRLSAGEQDAAEHARMGRQVATFGEVSAGVPRSVVPDIQRLGSIRTQHETGRSQGAFNPELRSKVERDMGYDESPVYGYFQRSLDEEPPYGNVTFHLKSSVKDRTYVHPGDSLNYSRSGSYPTEHAREVISGDAPAPPPPDPEQSYETTDYIEAHILPDARSETLGMRAEGYTSRVPLEDVSRVSVHEGSLRFDPDGARRDDDRQMNFQVGGDLAREGFVVDHVLSDIVEQPSLPMQYNDGPQPSSKFSVRRRRVPHKNLTEQDRGGAE